MALKKKSKIFITFLVLFILGIGWFQFFGPAVHKTKSGFLYIKTGSTMNQLEEQLLKDTLLKTTYWFKTTANIMKFTKVRPGKYKVPGGMSMVSLVRMLKNGQQTPVDFVVTKIRTRQALAGKLGRSFEMDSLDALQFLSSSDSLRVYGLDSNTVMAAVLPLTYSLHWNTTPRVIMKDFFEAYKRFWTPDKKALAAQQGLDPIQATTMASIIDEETNKASDRPNIASTYLNRLRKGMPLQADPTVKFALKDFGIKRILFKHLTVESPFNTYRNKGLPPGPINTPQETTIMSVLQAPKTEYLYFVANSNFDGSHVFTTNYTDHMKLAKQYQEALNIQIRKRDSLQSIAQP